MADKETRYSREGAVKHEIYDWMQTIVHTVIALMLIFVFVGRVADVFGTSMNPTLNESDRLIIWSLGYTPKNGDIVVVTKPNSEASSLVKRVIATGGQTVDIDFEKHTVTVDGVVLDEPYIKEPTAVSYDMTFPVTVPENHVFVMGDNRNGSWDSRDSELGMIDNRYILGKAIFRIYPFDEMTAF